MKKLWRKYSTNIMFGVLIITLLYYNSGFIVIIKRWVMNNVNVVAVVFSGISSTVALLALLHNVKMNNRTQKQYQESLAPLLVFKLIEIKGCIYLQITNKGKIGAKDLRVRYLGLCNNGDEKLVEINQLSNPFDLFPEESVQGLVALYGMNTIVSPIGVFPILEIEIEYFIVGTKDRKSYKRNVTYFQKEKSSDLYLRNLDRLNQNIKKLNRAVLRIANYFDGYAIMEFDEINCSPRTSLKNDLIDAMNNSEKDEILSREDTLTKCESIGLQTEDEDR